MVSRQETAHALLTPGEVMHLPPTDELVLVSGLSPIRATKLRYYEAPIFAERILPAPTLMAGPYLDRPALRADAWEGAIRAVDERLAVPADVVPHAANESSPEQQLVAGAIELDAKIEQETVPAKILALDDDIDPAVDEKPIKRSRSRSVARRAFAIDEGQKRQGVLGLGL